MRTIAIAIAAAALSATAMLPSSGVAEAKGKCALTTAEGTDMPLDFAKAKAAEILKDKLDAAKLKGKGKISYKCEVDVFASTCKASQMGCS